MGYVCAYDIVALTPICLYASFGEFLAVRLTDLCNTVVWSSKFGGSAPHQKSRGVGVCRGSIHLELAHSSGTG